MTANLWAIGDVQGCMAPFERLLEKIGWSPATDRLWLAGDLVNRGPRSLDVLGWARAHEASVVSVLGNHDLHLIGRARGAVKAKRRDTLDEVLEKAADLVDWLARRPLVHEEVGQLLVHAGIPPGWTLEEVRRRSRTAEALLAGPSCAELLAGRDDWTGPFAEARQTLAALTRLRIARPDGRMLLDFDGTPADAPPGSQPWWELLHPSIPPTVSGHWARAGVVLHPRGVALDSGCVWGGKLSAVRISDRRLVQVDCPP